MPPSGQSASRSPFGTREDGADDQEQRVQNIVGSNNAPPVRGPAAQLDQRVHWHLVQAGKQVDQRQVQPHVPVRGPRIEVLRLITSDDGKPREAK